MKTVDERLFEWMREIRREIHRWPETEFNEIKTSRLICDRLDSLGIGYRQGLAKTGVVARIKGVGQGPAIALRADMDALPIGEETGLPFASNVPGVMHACGHDGHVAIVLGAAALLKDDPPAGDVVLIFQPAEEGSGGALPMIEEGALDGVDIIYGGHIEPGYDSGLIVLKSGALSAATDVMEITLNGRGGHAARPHETVDPITIAAHMILHFQTIIAREKNPLHPAVISIGVIEAGTAYNAIAKRCVIKGTIRTTVRESREQLLKRIGDYIEAVSRVHEIEIEYTISKGYPPMTNHDRELGFARETALKLYGPDNILNLEYPSLGGEDFAYFLEKIPGCYIKFGAAIEGKRDCQAHSSTFDFDETVLKTAAEYFAELIRYTGERVNGINGRPFY